MAAVCKNCGPTDDYNFVLERGLCNKCIENLIEDLQDTVRWMLTDRDFRSQNLGIDSEDSPEVALARKLVKL